MRIKTIPSLFALIIALFLTAAGLAAPARAQDFTSLFHAPWDAFDTGTWAVGFEPSGGAPAGLKAADLDGDGDLDLVTGSASTATPGIIVLRNNGDGTYAPRVTYTLPEDKSVADIALADVDKDGDRDVLATAPDYNGLSNILALWRNNGDGTFAPYQLYSTGPGPKGLAVADFNGDGFEDVATANHGSVSRANNTFSIVLHNGQAGAAAGFLPHTEFTVEGMDAQRVAAADLNGDGRADLAVGGHSADFTGGRIAVLLNNGAGGFAPAAYYASYPGTRLPSPAVAFSDLDRDGDADLIAAGMVTNQADDRAVIAVRRNAGDGSFGAPEAYVSETNLGSPHDLAVGDLNGDTYPDVVATTPTGRTMDGWLVIVSNGAGGFKPLARYEGSQMTTHAVVADVDGDGDADVAAAAQAALAVTVHRNLGDGTFLVLPRIRLGQVQNDIVGNGHTALVAGDLDGDGDPDLVSADAKAWIIRNQGGGSFAEPELYQPPVNPGEVKLHDLNGDGRLDLLFGPDRNAPPYHFGVSLNLGGGAFGPGAVVNVDACQAGSIDTADFDGDGDRDVVLAEEGACMNGGGGLYLYRNDGRGGFTRAGFIDTACIPAGLAVGDFNRDGRADFITAGCNGLSLFAGRGDLTFGPPSTTATEGNFRFKAADLNGDQKLDLVFIQTVWNTTTTVIATALGHGDGTFAAPRQYAGSSGGQQLIVSWDIDTADFDGDGDRDVLVANNAAGDISLFYNEGDGSLRRHERYGAGSSSLFVTPADYDGDGAVDIATGIGLPPLGAIRAVVVLRNTRLDGAPPRRLSITGRVTDAGGAGISGAEVTLGGAFASRITTGANGGFGFEGLTEGENYNVSVSKDGVEFTPASHSFAPLSHNQTVTFVGRAAAPATYSVGGRVTLNGAGFAGVTVTLTGARSATATTDAGGAYTFAGLPAGADVTVVPSKDGYTFSPGGKSFPAVNANTTADFSASPVTVSRFNHALASRGATIKVSSTLDAGRAAAAAINGERAGAGWGANPSTGSGWHDATGGAYPDWVEIDFGGRKSVDEVSVFSVQDNVSYPSAPTEAMTFTKYGVTDFNVEYRDEATGAWVPVPGGMVTGNSKVWRKLTFPAVTTTQVRVVVAGALAGYSRLTEVEAWGNGLPSALVNHALATEGARATASSEMDAGRAAAAAINGDRRGLHWGTDPATGSGWHDATQNKYTDWLEVAFGGPRTIQQVNVFSVQDEVFAPSEPTEAMTFTKYGVTNFRVEYWDATAGAWAGVPGLEVWGNDKVWRTVTFAPVTTTKIRVVVILAQAGYSRLTEVEAWGQTAGATPPPASPVNHAAASNGATAAASSTLDSNRAPLAAINGDRRGQNWGGNPATGSGWHDATGGAYPDWLEVSFNGQKTISEVSVFSVQDNVFAPSAPTEAMTFTQYGVTDFDVEYWTGSAWQIVPGGMVTGNHKVWRKLTFTPLQTTKIRVVSKGALAGYSRITEVEAY